MSLDVPSDTDLVTLPSAHDAAETAERFKAALGQKGIKVFADIDHAAEASRVGLTLRPTRVLIFGNPQAGTPLMQSRQTLGLDLPLRVLVWQDDDGKSWLTYRRTEALARSRQILGHDKAIKALDDGLAALARAATAQ
jgi:uncharacterized protein (DUF302 family)